MALTWIATAIEWRGGAVFLGLADAARSRALQQYCAHQQSRCAEIFADTKLAPLHYMQSRNIEFRILHEWSDGSREVAVILPGEASTGPERTGTLRGRLVDGWVIASGLDEEAEKELCDLLCSQEKHDFAVIYGTLRELGAKHGAP